jgi:hypothetical protein
MVDAIIDSEVTGPARGALSPTSYISKVSALN